MLSKNTFRISVIVLIYLIAFICTVFLVSTLSKKQIDAIPNVPINKIEFGDEKYNQYILYGFSFPENNSWRWTDGMKSKIVFPLKKNQKYEMIFTMQPFPIKGKIQKVEITMNDRKIGEIELINGQYREYSLEIPSNLALEKNTFIFKYAYAESPKKLSGSNDIRRLGVNFKEIRFQEK
ncbi:hypothetical protein SK3146_03165 [Paenibacillus konkukensis]|uniref:Uncharacterized protein n=1 Tax=Paenibacillus konkukensis TaxID=2020716 RepID=A0ABY4RR16_9BACL|nr:hypothetical protein [Paenibacillus konkukensis]UQZ83953.1 hypothetical protein SK3146_03165 [Paenibacillus konkukensis]